MSVINYLSLNSIYVIIASIFIILFIILNIFLFINFELELSKSLNDNCENPIAIYFDKSNRERCLTEKITKKNETSVNEAEHEIKKTTLKTNIDKINTQIKDSYNYLNNILTMPSPEIQKISKEIPNLDDLNSYINSTFENTSSAIKKINADFENTINTNIQLAINLGNSLVDSLIQMTYTKKVKDKRKKMVNSYNKIKKYLNNQYIQPYLDKIKDNSDNLTKIQKINKELSKKTKNGPGK
jgi:methyl-accepting chemotaxis protein